MTKREGRGTEVSSAGGAQAYGALASAMKQAMPGNDVRVEPLIRRLTVHREVIGVVDATLVREEVHLCKVDVNERAVERFGSWRLHVSGSFDVGSYLGSVADRVGLALEFPAQLAGLPCLRSADDRLLPLYQIFEHVDGQTDLDAVSEELPTLRYSQLASTMEFVRKVLQYNERGIDIDDLEDEHLVEQGLVGELRQALEDGGEG